MRAADFLVAPKEGNPLRGREPGETGGFRSKEEAREKLESDVSKLAERQEIFLPLDRIDRSEKRWKFSLADIQERGHWREYESA